MLEDFPANQPMNESLTVMTGLAATIIFTLPNAVACGFLIRSFTTKSRLEDTRKKINLLSICWYQ